MSASACPASAGGLDAMFAASFSTLKKRTKEFTKELLKGEDGGGGGAGGGGGGRRLDDELDGLEPGELSNFAPVGQMILRYEVQNGTVADQESSAFLLPMPDADASITGGLIRSNFPMPGQFHFRFKAPTGDGSFGGFVWVDLANDKEFAPVYRGEIYMKVLKLPDGVKTLTHTSIAGGLASFQTSASRPPPPPVQTGAGPLGSAVDAFGAMPASQLPQMPTSQPSVQTSPPPRVAPAPPDDLMELGAAMSPPSSSPGGSPPSRSPPTPTPPPVVMPDRAKLVAEREAAEKAAVDAANRVHTERRNSEEQLKKDKLHMSNKLYAEMDGWAKTADGQNFKDVRTLISTVHTVLWPNSGWQPLPLSELVAKDSNVKKYYRKAVLMCHPDKQTEADPERQVRADRIFQALNEAFKASGDS